MGLFSFLSKRQKSFSPPKKKTVPKKNTGTTTNPTYPQLNKIKQSAYQEYYDMYREDILDYRYTYTTDSLIDKLSRVDGDMGNAVHNFLIAIDSGFRLIAKDVNGIKNDRATKRLKLIADRFKGDNIDRSLDTLMKTIARLLIVRGGVGVEVRTDKSGRITSLYIVDPKWVDWYREGNEYVAYQNGEMVSSPFLFWAFADPDVDSVQHISPLLTALNIIFFRMGVLQDLERVIKRAGFDRLNAKLLEDVMVRNAPVSVKRNPNDLRTWLEARRTEIQTILTNLKPDDAIATYDSVELSYLKGGVKDSIDVEPLMKVLDQQISSGLKTLPSILGRGGSASDTESVLYVRNIKYFQNIASILMGNVLSFCLQKEGVNASAYLEYNDVDLRSPLEIENHKLMKQKRILLEGCLGFRTIEEVCYELTGHELPKKFDENWFDSYRNQQLGIQIGTTDDDWSDEGNYNELPEEQKPGEDTIDTRTDDEKEDNNIKNMVRVLKFGGDK